MERNERYKDSGVEWIGEIPEEWEVKKLKYIADTRPSNIHKKSKDEEEEVLLCNYVDVYKNEFISSELDFMMATASQEQKEKFLLQKGDVLATKDSETPDDIAIPALVVEDFDNVVCGYHLTHIKPKKIIGSYLFRYFQTKYLSSYFEVSANGVTRYGLGVDKFGSALILNPPLEEQTAIANYLDRKTAEIDALIAQKQRLIELYQEEKTAIINQAVTKGMGVGVPLVGTLNNNGAEQGNHKGLPLRESGIDWLGQIPAEWVVSKAKFVSRIFVPQRNKPELNSDEGLPWLTMEDMSSNRVINTALKVSEQASKNAGSKVLKKGSVIASCVGNFGICAINDVDVIINQQLQAFIPLKDVIPEYFLEIVKISKDYFQMVATAATVGYVNQSGFANMPILIMSLEEQTAIVHHIETETARIDAKIAKTKCIIELQKEYRNALISEVVTGKIKVTS